MLNLIFSSHLWIILHSSLDVSYTNVPFIYRYYQFTKLPQIYAAVKFLKILTHSFLIDKYCECQEHLFLCKSVGSLFLHLPIFKKRSRFCLYISICLWLPKLIEKVCTTLPILVTYQFNNTLNEIGNVNCGKVSIFSTQSCVI